MSIQYIIDGYNVTNHPAFKRQLPKNILDSRLALIQLIKSRKLCGSNNNFVWVVFDGFQGESGCFQQEMNLRVIYSREDSADNCIKRILEKCASPKNIVVVSDDKEIVLFARLCKARTSSVEGFLSVGTKLRQKSTAALETEITFSQMHKINEELKKKWLS